MTIAPNAPVAIGRGRRALGIARDLVIATALIWALPLLFGVVIALSRLIANLFS